MADSCNKCDGVVKQAAAAYAGEAMLFAAFARPEYRLVNVDMYINGHGWRRGVARASRR